MAKLTEWYDGRVTVPGQPGYYERDYGTVMAPHWPSIWRDYWDGVRWQWPGGRPSQCGQDYPWRGLREPANG